MTKLTKLPPLSEREFTANVITVAHLYGWHIAHFRPARMADGSWRTPLQADGAGFPDLVLVRPPRVIFAELKTEVGKLDPLQKHWLQQLRGTSVEVYVWRPHQLHVEIQAALAAPVTGTCEQNWSDSTLSQGVVRESYQPHTAEGGPTHAGETG